MSPLSEVSHSVPPPQLWAASPVPQNEPRTSGWTPRPISGRQKPSPNGSNWHPPPKSADEELRWSSSFWPFGAVDGLLVAWRFSSNLHASSDVVGQSLSCVAKCCLCILETPPASWLLLAENCHLPTTWQFAAVFALANFAAWSPLKVQRNINSFYRNPTLHTSIKVVMAKQTSLQVTTPELTFSFSWVSAVHTILTVFGHSIWLHNGSMKSTVFRSTIEHTTRNNEYRSNSRKCHLVVVIPKCCLLVYLFLIFTCVMLSCFDHIWIPYMLFYRLCITRKHRIYIHRPSGLHECMYMNAHR